MKFGDVDAAKAAGGEPTGLVLYEKFENVSGSGPTTAKFPAGKSLSSVVRQGNLACAGVP